MRHFLESALEITEQASSIPRSYFRKDVSIDQKQDESPVTIADRETEAFIRKRLSNKFPDHGIFGEEFGRSTAKSSYEWIIDPIDGTRSFITGNPLYGMLMALLKDGVPQLGIVRMPELNEVYVGFEGVAIRNGDEKLHVSSITQLSDAAIYINEGDKMQAQHPELFNRLCSIGKTKRLAYDCYPHMLLAAGHIDAVVDFDLQPYDYMPLVTVVEGAGGVMTDWEGKKLTLNSDGKVVGAATPALHETLLCVINQT
ncbi:MAG: inositol monophosphatase family protein [Hyphomicrobiales bacterium]